MPGQFKTIENKYRKFLEYSRDNGSDYDDSVEEYEAALRREFDNLTPSQRTALFRQILRDTQNELEDCFVENHTLRALELMILEQLLKQVVGE